MTLTKFNTVMRQQGFSLLELALVMLVIGTLLFFTVGGGSSGGRIGGSPTATGRADGSPQAQSLSGLQNRVVDAVTQYAQRHYRLPCADTSTPPNGIEGNGSGCGSAAAHQVGRVPFVTLGIPAPGGADDPLQQALVYAVYQDTALQYDLTRIQQPDKVRPNQGLPGDSPYAGRNDFLRALQRIAEREFLVNKPHITGDNGAFGAVDCDSNRVTNVAFLVVSGGMRDANQSDSRFDGVHTIPDNPAGSLAIRCFAAPTTPRTEIYDDVVVAVGFRQLAGELLTVGRR